MYRKLFFEFAKIGTFSIGGGLAMIPLIEQAIVHKNQWITEEEFEEMMAITQSVPGLIAVNISILVGNKLKGVKGGIVSAIGSTLPSFLMILTIAIFFSNFLEVEWVKQAFTAIRPIVTGLILVPIYNAVSKNKPSLIFWTVIIASMLSISIFHISPIWILLFVALLGIFNTYLSLKNMGGHKK